MRFKEWSYEVPQVALDYGFVDTSYHNDVCAAMTHDVLKFILWVEDPIRENREYVEHSRFMLFRGDYESYEDNPCCDCETEDELRAYFAGLGMVPVDRKALAYAKLREVQEKAEEAFWAKVAEAFPDADAGDFPFDADFHFMEAQDAAIKLWVDINVLHVFAKEVR